MAEKKKKKEPPQDRSAARPKKRKEAGEGQVREKASSGSSSQKKTASCPASPDLAGRNLTSLEEQLLLTQRLARIGTWQFDLPTKKLWWSEEMYRIFGVQEKKPLAMDRFLSTVHPDDRQNLEAEITSGLPHRSDYRIVLPDGTIRHIHEAVEILHDERGMPVSYIGTAQDVTEQKAAENRLRESEQQLSALSANIADGMVYQVNAGHDGRTRQFTYISPAVERFHSLSVDAVLKDASLLYNQIMPEDRVAVAEQESRAFAGKSKLEVEVRVRMPSGKIAWRRFTSSPRQDADGIWVWDGIEIDITDRKQEEETLKQSERRYKAIVENQVEFVARYLPRGILTFVNDTLCRYVGMKKEDLLGTSFYPFMHPDDRPAFVRKIESLSQSKPVMTAEARVVLPDGRVTWHLWTHQAIFDDLGALVEYQCTGRDITGQKRMGQELQESGAKYKFLVEETGTGFVILDDKGLVLDANDEYVRLSGHARHDEILGRSVVEWTAAHDRKRNAAEVKKCLERGSVKNLEIDYVHTDGTLVTVEINATVMYARNERRIFTLCRDVTGRKRAEDKRRRDMLNLYRAEHVAGIGNWEWNVLTNEIFWSDGVYRIYGADPLTFRPSYEIIVDTVAPEDRERFKNAVEDSLANNAPFDAEYRMIGLDGRERFTHTIGEVERDRNDRAVAMFGIIQDITERKRAEEALRQSEERYRAIIESQVEFVDRYLPGGVLTYVNAALARYVGMKPDDLVGRSFYPFVHPDDRDDLIGKIESLSRDNPVIVTENRVLLHDGSLRWHQWTHQAIFDDADSIAEYQSIGRDITERKQMEERLIENEHLLNTILDNVGAAIFIKDTSSRYTYVNQRVCDIFGRSRDEILGRSDDAFFSAASVEEIVRSDRPVIEQGETVMREETGLTSADGVPRSYWTVKIPLRDSSGRIKGLCGISTDITSLKKAEDELLRSRQWLALHVQQTPLAVIEFDLEGRIRGWNPAAVKIFGFSHDEAIGQHWHFMVPENVWGLLDGVWEGLVTQRGGSRSTNRNITKDGRVIDCEWFNTPLIDDNGNTIGVASLVMDVTMSRQAEQALRESEERFRAIYDNIGVGIAVISKDMEILSINPQMQKWFSHVDMNGRHICYRTFNIPPRETVCEYCPTAHTLQDGKVHTAVTDTPTPDGIRHYQIIATPIFAEDGTVEAAIEMVEDVTENRRAELALRTRERQLAESQRIAHVGSWEHNLRTGRVFWSDELFRVIGLDPEKDPADFGMFFAMVHPEDRPALKEAIDKTRREKSAFNIEYRLILRDGVTRIIHAQAELLPDETGDMVVLSGTGQDITERKRAEDALRESQQLMESVINTAPT